MFILGNHLKSLSVLEIVAGFVTITSSCHKLNHTSLGRVDLSRFIFETSFERFVSQDVSHPLV
jgi:hypothetical protein